ncbi:MAG: hypothetical protein HY700_10945 [Gemmatimonadetes bacterium]|nr:hypothetical protein [Gemmatimonadota bacterium]
MHAKPKQIYPLCPACSECPTVEVQEDGTVRIGEEPNVVTLQGREWNELVKAVRTGALTEIA